MSANPIPQGYHSITPYLVVDGAAEAIRFYGQAFGATELMRLPMPVQSGVEGEDKIGHAEIRIGDSIVMLADEFPDMDVRGPKSRGGATSSLLFYTGGVDAAFKRAIDAGCTAEEEPEDKFWGDRMGTLVDPFGHRWSIATHMEDLSDDEIQRRMEQFSGGDEGAETA